MIICPRCGRDDTLLMTDHYYCNYCQAEFKLLVDDYKRFPYNCIFPNRIISEFYRKPYYVYSD